jgi:hypothetical protein
MYRLRSKLVCLFKLFSEYVIDLVHIDYATPACLGHLGPHLWIRNVQNL